MTRADEFFHVRSVSRPTVREQRSLQRDEDRPSRYMVEKRNTRLPDQRWEKTIDPLAGLKETAIDKMMRCRNSQLISYYPCEFRVREIRTNKIVATAKHRSLDKDRP